MLGRRTMLAASIFALSSPISRVAAQEGALPDLLPERANPAQAGLDMPALVRRAIEIFDAPGEQRWYSRLDQLDGLTIGFGHWPQSRFGFFLAALRAHDGGAAYQRLIARLSEYYAGHSLQWSRAPGATEAVSVQAVSALLDRTLYAPAFMQRYAGDCRQDERHYCVAGSPSFFLENCAGDNDWIGSALRYALRDRVLVQWQVALWNADVIDPVRAVAASIGLSGDGGIIALASMNSSKHIYVRDFRRGALAGRLSLGETIWDWTRPGADAPTTEAALASWRKLVAWQYYTYRENERRFRAGEDGRIRGRSVLYFRAFLAADWRVAEMRAGAPAPDRARANVDPNRVSWIG